MCKYKDAGHSLSSDCDYACDECPCEALDDDERERADQESLDRFLRWMDWRERSYEDRP